MTTNADGFSGTTPAFDLRTLPEGIDLVAIMRGEIEGNPGTAPCWVVSDGDDFPVLTVGLRREVGALLWDHGTTAFRPVDGTNDEDADYFLGNRDHSPFPPRTELPIDLVLTAVREYARTGERPTCVEWEELT
ncbi:Imm1 family immunity protein [Saccharopolyspora cebuensis]|uniref:Imm1 family immunity protein n=1 Tax=Saccharopolyspora cebuensis TaxID=418759 RepID=A0ABV4CGR1_9PSEU